MFRSLFFQTFSTSCWMMPVSRIRLCSSRLSPEQEPVGHVHQHTHLL